MRSLPAGKVISEASAGKSTENETVIGAFCGSGSEGFIVKLSTSHAEASGIHTARITSARMIGRSILVMRKPPKNERLVVFPNFFLQPQIKIAVAGNG